MATSTAISESLITRAVGYKLFNQQFEVRTTNLPMRIALLGEPNTANEPTLDTDPYQPLTAKEVGDKYGYGSPLYQMARILLPKTGGGIGAVPLIVYPQKYSTTSAPTPTVITLGVAVATTVTKTTTHTLKINGRDNYDGVRFDFTVTAGDVTATVVSAITDCINNVLASPCSAATDTGVVVVTSKWKGLTSAGMNIEILTNGDAAGIVYSEVSKTDGTGTPSIADAITAFGNEWNTIVINPYSVVSVLAELEAANGTQESTTGKYTTTVFKPFISLFGSTEDDKDALVAITNAAARQDQVTNVLCPAPASKGMDFEAAANAAAVLAPIANDSPHLGVGGKSYPDMPIPTDGIIGDMADIMGRNFCVQKGCSTVLLENGKYTIQDFVTTYVPDGEASPKFRYVRDLIVDWNIGFNWKIIMIRDIQDKTLVGDMTPSRVGNTISPKQVKALLSGLIKESELDALLTDSEFSIRSASVGINQSVPTRLDISFKYKRTSTANQISTDAAVDFSYNL